MLKQCNLVELFSGIGSQAKALKNLGVKVNIQGTSEWDVHAIAAYDVIHSSGEISEDIKAMSKLELLEVLSKYTFSNSGKEPLEFSSLRTYSIEVLQRLYASITRNKNFVDATRLD
jgi:DNA (cytosine-5)-methyltransferase 1